MSNKFWQEKPLHQLNESEWESLCDGCARCCLNKLEEEESGEIYYTDIACQYLENEKCQCSDYAHRNQLVPECVLLTPENISQLKWMPSTCAYRLLSEGKDLPYWHPLVSDDEESVHLAGISIRNRVFQQNDVPEDQWVDHIVDWPE